jgi:hypothetical protein
MNRTISAGGGHVNQPRSDASTRCRVAGKDNPESRRGKGKKTSGIERATANATGFHPDFKVAPSRRSWLRKQTPTPQFCLPLNPDAGRGKPTGRGDSLMVTCARCWGGRMVRGIGSLAQFNTWHSPVWRSFCIRTKRGCTQSTDASKVQVGTYAESSWFGGKPVRPGQPGGERFRFRFKATADDYFTQYSGRNQEGIPRRGDRVLRKYKKVKNLSMKADVRIMTALAAGQK